jgi:CRP-like cAMP-binding protein
MLESGIGRNLLVQRFPPEAQAAIAGAARVVEIQLNAQVWAAYQTRDVFFPIDGVISIVRNLEDGSTAEVAMVGAEGAAGVNGLLGAPPDANEGITQGRGLVAIVPASVVQDIIDRDAGARRVLMLYVFVYLTHAGQLAACNRLHVVEQRLAHWLLLLRDRVGVDEMSVTQEFLGHMLATRRAGISAAMKTLTKSGAIEHGRNRVRIVDREKLEAASCECYAANVAEYERVLGFSPRLHGRSTPVD